MDTDFNPFKAPAAEVALPATPPVTMTRASPGRRFGTFVVDYAGFMLLGAAVGLVVGLTLGPAGVEMVDRAPGVLLGLSIFLGYYLFFEGIWGRTPGKWLFGTQVVNEQGGRPTFAQILGRTLCRFIPFEALSCFGDAPWHDRIPKTRVVRVRKGG